MRVTRIRLVGYVAAAMLVASSGVAVGRPLDGPLKIEVNPLIDGLWDPVDPPLLVGVDPSLAVLQPPAHPWMLFRADELDAVRGVCWAPRRTRRSAGHGRA